MIYDLTIIQVFCSFSDTQLLPLVPVNHASMGEHVRVTLAALLVPVHQAGRGLHATKVS